MIVRTLRDCEDSSRNVLAENGNWQSIRMLLADDNMGFSFHITRIFAGTETPIHYKHHLESVYCISGRGEVETCEDGKIYKIEPGTIYILDKNDKHLLRASETMELACVFNPPITGQEVHGPDGAYPKPE